MSCTTRDRTTPAAPAIAGARSPDRASAASTKRRNDAHGSDPISLRLRAVACRELCSGPISEAVRQTLLGMADGYEDRARLLDELGAAHGA